MFSLFLEDLSDELLLLELDESLLLLELDEPLLLLELDESLLLLFDSADSTLELEDSAALNSSSISSCLCQSL